MFKPTTLKRVAMAVACAAGLGVASSASAANWLMLQGTEHPKKKGQRLFAFIQPAYSDSKGDKVQGLVDPATGNPLPTNGLYAVPNTVTPDFNETSQVYMRRARLGSRGTFTGAFANSFTAKMNYFFLLALDDGLFNQNQFSGDRNPVTIDHASVTFNHIPGARIRAGLFKNPISEEIFQAVNTIDFIEFTTFGAQHVLENFYSGSFNTVGTGPSLDNTVGTPDRHAYGFSAARDWGIQVFDSFKVANKSWDLSYAIKVGRGEAIRQGSDTDDNKELYLYASAEKNLPGGRGPRKNGIKYYAWLQDGKRQFSSDSTDQEFDRRRYGIGVKGLGKFFGSKYKQRFGAELAYAEGMIFNGPAGGVARGDFSAGPGSVMFATDDDNKARGIQIEYGFYLNKNWQFDARWAVQDRLYERSDEINPGAERKFTETTLGATYHFTKKARMTFNYTFRDVEVPNDYDTSTGVGNTTVVGRIQSNADIVADSIGDRIGLQLTYIF